MATTAIRGARHVYMTEDVNLLAKIRSSGVTVVGITNSEDGPFAREVQIPLTAFGKPSAVGVTVIVTDTALPAFTLGGVAGPARV